MNTGTRISEAVKRGFFFERYPNEHHVPEEMKQRGSAYIYYKMLFRN
jgi:hypothetical protein